jgi:hypothetical protein
VEEGTKGTPKCRPLEICIFKHNCACLSSQLHQHWFQILACQTGDDASHHGASCKVYLLDEWVSDQRICNFGSILWAVVDQVQTSFGETSFTEAVCDGPVGSWTEFGAFEDGGVTRRKCVGDGSNPKGVWGIPEGISCD